MFEIPSFDPWVGPDYCHAALKLLVLGESRYDEDFTDRTVIEWRIEGKFKAGQKRTFTNFEKAVLGTEYSVAEATAFWRRVAFYNFNTSVFPGKPRVRVNHRDREHPQNVKVLRTVLSHFTPSHAIVWGKTNWKSIDAGAEWIDNTIPVTNEPYSATTIDGHTTLFTRVCHPSCGFSSEYWGPVLASFLALPPRRAAT